MRTSIEQLKREALADLMIGKRAIWKIRVHGPAKFDERSGVIAFVSGNSAFTDQGRELRICDMVDAPSAVIGGGTWAVTDSACAAVDGRTV
jgi:hypothetical protein